MILYGTYALFNIALGVWNPRLIYLLTLFAGPFLLGGWLYYRRLIKIMINPYAWLILRTYNQNYFISLPFDYPPAYACGKPLTDRPAAPTRVSIRSWNVRSSPYSWVESWETPSHWTRLGYSPPRSPSWGSEDHPNGSLQTTFYELSLITNSESILHTKFCFFSTKSYRRWYSSATDLARWVRTSAATTGLRILSFVFWRRCIISKLPLRLWLNYLYAVG